jgi:hypothetical protein
MNAIDDEEFFEQGKILPMDDIRVLVRLLRTWLQKLYWTNPLFDGDSLSENRNRSRGSATSSFSSSPKMPPMSELQIQIAVTRLFNQLYTRHERRAFLPEEQWQFRGIPRLDAEAVSEILDSDEASQPLELPAPTAVVAEEEERDFLGFGGALPPVTGAGGGAGRRSGAALPGSIGSRSAGPAFIGAATSGTLAPSPAVTLHQVKV